MKKCPICDFEIDDNVCVCPNCNNKIDFGSETNDIKNDIKKLNKKSDRHSIIGILLIIVVIIAVVVLLFATGTIWYLLIGGLVIAAIIGFFNG